MSRVQSLPTHEEHHDLGAAFMGLNSAEVVANYGDVASEFTHLKTSAAVLDFSSRTRLVVIGRDRIQFLHSQCTNDIKGLAAHQGCYTVVTNNKGRVQGDANVFVFEDEVLLDSEPGQTDRLMNRLEQFIVSDDIELIDAAPHYGLLTVQGPRCAEVIESLGLEILLPSNEFNSVKCDVPVIGELYLVNNPRLRTNGFDLFAPLNALGALLDKLITAAKQVSGGLCGWEAFNVARVEAGIPQYGFDMTEANLAPEAGIAERAISYNKGCYIGQEVLNRLRTFAEVNKKLCRLRVISIQDSNRTIGAKLLKDGKEIGVITSFAAIPNGDELALGYVRKEWHQSGETFDLDMGGLVEQLGVVG